VQIRAVLFDCDGVLVDSEPITNTLLAEDLTARGLPLSMDECIALFVGGTIRGVTDKARALGADLPDDWPDLFYARMFARLAEGCPVIPGIEGAVARLAAAGMGLAVGSNGPLRKMEVTLGQHPVLRAAFGPHIHSAPLLGRPKPDPLVWLHAAERLGVAPGACVVVEDSATGARAARAAGMRCLGYAAHGGADLLAAEGAEIFADMADLPRLVGI
jgi:HAD superfamily hydrolase (TIGR01509 family)